MPTKILIVDDDPFMIDALKRQLLKKTDYEIYEARDGEDALVSLKDVHPDLIVLDVIMPKMNGYRTCEKIRENDELKNIPVIFLTGQNDDDWEVVTAYTKGCDIYLTKPMDISGEFYDMLIDSIVKLTQPLGDQ